MFLACCVAPVLLQTCVWVEPVVPYALPERQPTCTCSSSLASEPKPSIPAAPDDGGRGHTFAEMTLFLFGGGVALFVALLGWSDQIKGINSDTRELERRFLTTTGIDRKVFLSVVRSESPAENLRALTEIYSSGKLKTAPDIEVLGIFQNWNRKWTALERLSKWKYRLSIVLTYSLFLGGLLSLLITPHSEVQIFNFRASVPLLILIIPMLGFLGILTMITVANFKEAYFHDLLRALSERM